MHTSTLPVKVAVSLISLTAPVKHDPLFTTLTHTTTESIEYTHTLRNTSQASIFVMSVPGINFKRAIQQR